MPYIQEGKQSAWQAKEPSDGVLVGQAVAGYERAFEALVNRYQHVLLNSIRRILKDDELAYDVLQCVLLKFYVSLPTLRRDVRVKAWLFQVAHTAVWMSYASSVVDLRFDSQNSPGKMSTMS